MSTRLANQLYIHNQYHATDTAVAPISTDHDRQSATVMGVHLETANGGEHAPRKSTLIHGACAQLLGKEFVALLSPANVCGCELSVPNQHFRNAGPQPTFLKCSTGYRPGYYPALQADQIVEPLAVFELHVAGDSVTTCGYTPCGMVAAVLCRSRSETETRRNFSNLAGLQNQQPQ